jgi:hypothetical protein
MAIGCQHGYLWEVKTIGRDYIFVPVVTLLGSPLKGLIVCTNQTKTLAETFGPLEIIEK